MSGRENMNGNCTYVWCFYYRPYSLRSCRTIQLSLLSLTFLLSNSSKKSVEDFAKLKLKKRVVQGEWLLCTKLWKYKLDCICFSDWIKKHTIEYSAIFFSLKLDFILHKDSVPLTWYSSKVRQLSLKTSWHCYLIHLGFCALTNFTISSFSLSKMWIDEK